jgi:hypothetical protein
MVRVRRLPQLSPADLDALARLLADCVEGGASVSFMHPLPLAKARAFWQQLAEDVGRGERALLAAAEREARDGGKTLLVLDTASPEAERLYARAGWQRCGSIPGYALLPQGGLCATTFFYRELR